MIARFLVPRSATTMRTHGTETALGGICHSRFLVPGYLLRGFEQLSHHRGQGISPGITTLLPCLQFSPFLSLFPSLFFVFRESCCTSVLPLLSTSPWLLLSKLPPFPLIRSRGMPRPTGSGYLFLMIYSHEFSLTMNCISRLTRRSLTGLEDMKSSKLTPR